MQDESVNDKVLFYFRVLFSASQPSSIFDCAVYSLLKDMNRNYNYPVSGLISPQHARSSCSRLASCSPGQLRKRACQYRGSDRGSEGLITHITIRRRQQGRESEQQLACLLQLFYADATCGVQQWLGTIGMPWEGELRNPKCHAQATIMDEGSDLALVPKIKIFSILFFFFCPSHFRTVLGNRQGVPRDELT